MIATRRLGTQAIRSLLGACGLAIGLQLVAGSALALPREECPTWFPDFRCERQGRYDGFVDPVTMPYLFESPFITTGLQFVGIWHDFPRSSVFQGGQAGVLALQARVAITDRLAFIATRDGFMVLSTDSTLPGTNTRVLDDQTGWMDIAAGFKFALFDMPEHDFIFTPALRFQIPVGQQKVFQGNGSGLIIPSFSFAKGFSEDFAGGYLKDLHVIGSFGSNVPFNSDKNNTNIFYNFHLDYAVWKYLVPFVELNGVHYVNSGNGGTKVKTTVGHITLNAAQGALQTGPFDGFDVANLGSRGIDNRNTVTMAGGIRIPIGRKFSIGVAYEHYIAGNRDIFKQRVTTALSWEL